MERRSRHPMHGPFAPQGDPIPEALAESIWLGGEAMVAPDALVFAAAPDTGDVDADPGWQVI